MSAPKPGDSEAAGGLLEGALPDLPELTWEDFERGSELSRRDLEGDDDEEVRRK
ncbi:MAG: hypothetical protein WKF43_01265 [Acidimicrobiales bacterium]